MKHKVVANTLTYAEFCAGIGGFRLGIDMSDHDSQCIYKNEINDKCEDTYMLNFNERFDSKDIFNIDSSELPYFDMLCAGFPCQAFSLAGKQQGFFDERGRVYLKIAKIIEDVLPPIVFLENVPNLIRHDNGNTINQIVTHLEDQNYKVYYDVLDSANFGIPQSRPRMYLVAFQKEIFANISFSFPKGSKRKTTIREILAYGDNSIPISKKWNEYIDLYSEKKALSDLSFDPPKTRKALERKSPNCDLSDCILQIRSSGIRAYSLDGQFPTFAVSNSGGGAMIPVLTKERRHISVQEIKRLMGFPDSFFFNTARTDSIKQLANAVCPPVINAIFNQIVTAITA